MDLKEFNTRDAHDEGAEIQIRNQFGELTDLFITVVGMDSKLWRSIDAERNRKVVQRLIDKTQVDTLNDDTPEYLAKASIAWRGATQDGEPVEFSQAAAAELYRSAPYIADQVDRFIGKRANFIKG